MNHHAHAPDQPFPVPLRQARLRPTRVRETYQIARPEKRTWFVISLSTASHEPLDNRTGAGTMYARRQDRRCPAGVAPACVRPRSRLPAGVIQW